MDHHSYKYKFFGGILAAGFIFFGFQLPLLHADTTSTDTTPSDNTGALIATGDASAASNILNVLNVNLTDANGLVQFLNLLAPYAGTVNFGESGGCTNCSTSTLDITNNNSSSILNNLFAVASSGANMIDGSGTIYTGDAFAAGNIINIANTNLTDSNYLLVVFNAASNLQGDIVLPGLDFFNSSSTIGTNAESSSELANNNSTTIQNNLDVHADTGNNSSTAEGDISTGSANAASNVLNLANTNITSGEPIIVLVRVFGTWNGTVFSAPPGLLWQQTSDGLMLTGPGAQNILQGNTSVTNNNNASVSNNLHVYALTGQNEVKGNGSINTGNASAVGNVINIINTNIVGRNVLLALVNIFGNWNGNLAFGQPNLWVGTQANLDMNPLQAGEPVTYHVTVTNRGNADATNVHIAATSNIPSMGTITDPGNGTLPNTSDTKAATDSTSSIFWDIPIIPVGTSRTFNFTQTMGPLAANGGEFTENITATEHEDDADPIDNTDSITFPTGYFRNGNAHDSDLYIMEANGSGGRASPSGTVHYFVTVGNKIDGGIANGVTLYEQLINPDGKVISGKTIHLGQLYPGTKKTISWDTAFPGDSPLGPYINFDILTAYDVVGVKHLNTSSSFIMQNPVIAPTPIP